MVVNRNPQPTEPLLMKPISDSLPKESAFNQSLNLLQKTMPQSTLCSVCNDGGIVFGNPPLCWRCQEKRDERSKTDKILEHIDDWTDNHMAKLGLSSREIRAELSKIPREIKRALNKETHKNFMAGGYPKKGWGIGGNTGSGKTMAMSAMFRAFFQSWAKHHAETKNLSNIRFEDSWVWSSWPDEVNWLRAHAIDPNVQDRVEILKTCDILFLDDLGRERIKGSYAEDWAASQLEGIINHRYRHELPTIWTTNLTLQQLADIYGGAMLSRLTADNPLIWVDNLKDLRG